MWFYIVNTHVTLVTVNVTPFWEWLKNHELKVKPWWVSARERKKSAFFSVTLVLFKGIFLTVFLSPCIVYWKIYQNIYTFTYQKALLHTLFYLFLKLSKNFSVFISFCFLGFFLHFRRKFENYLPMIPFSFSHSNKFIKNKCSLNKIRSGSLVNIRFILNKTAMEESIIKAGV